MSVTRRSFLGALAAFLGIGATTSVPVVAAPPVAPLAFHPDAFSMVFGQPVTRMDCLYGFGTLKQGFVVVQDDTDA